MVFPWFIPWLPSICGFLDLLAGSMGPGKYNSETSDLEPRFHSTSEAGVPHAYMASTLKLSPKHDTWLLSWQSPTHLFVNSRLKSKLFLWYATEYVLIRFWSLCFLLNVLLCGFPLLTLGLALHRYLHLMWITTCEFCVGWKWKSKPQSPHSTKNKKQKEKSTQTNPDSYKLF